MSISNCNELENKTRRRTLRLCYDKTDLDIVKKADKTQLEMINICKNIARKSNMIHKHGCIIVKNGIIISSGFNMRFSQDKQKTCSDISSLHAEMSAIRNCNKQLISDSDLYIVRVGSALRYSKPCKVCEKKIVKSGIKNVYYSINESV